MLQTQIVASIQEGIDLQQAILQQLVPAIAEVAQAIAQTLHRGNKILLMGNGGSATEAQHLAAELVGRFEAERAPLAAIALTADSAILTAIANDYGAETVFVRQIQALGKPGDLVIGLSTSGNSANILAGAKAAGELGLTMVGLTGESGGQLEPYCDLILKVPSRHTARIQEVHTLFSHLLCEGLEDILFETWKGQLPSVSHGPARSATLEKAPTLDVNTALIERLRRIKLLILDFDGVLTDNRVWVSQNRMEGVLCHRGDGWGIARLREAGLEMLVLSTEPNPVVQARCDKLKIDCIHGCNDKPQALNALAQERSISLEEIAYVGNDVNDLGCMERVGVPIAVADALPEIRSIACCVTTKSGGYGAVREVADLILAAWA